MNENRGIGIINKDAKVLKYMPIPPLLYSKAKFPNIIDVTYKKIIGRTKNKAFHKT